MSDVDTPLTLADIAQRISVGKESMRVYHARACRNRREGNPKPHDLPEPDAVLSRVPVWEAATIDRWVASRENRNLDHAV